MIKFIRNILILTLLLVVNATSMQGQERDRRADLEVRCVYNHAVSETGRLWLVTRCGKVHTADNIHSTWRTVIQPNERELSGPTFDRVAAFGDKVAVVVIPDSMLLKNYLDNNTLTPIYKFRTGDLLFCSKKNSEMEKAIGSSTGEYTHVAIVEVDSIGRVWIIEADGSEGVHRIPYSRWNYHFFGADAYRLNEPFDTTAVIERAKSFIGQPYDDCFLPNNGMMYCSELVYEAYLADDGSHLFKSKPMNFRDSRGKMPKYWKRHFRRLGIAIPEGVEGTNPTDMSKSPLLIKVL